MIGRVVSTKSAGKTVVVLVTRESRHPIYKKKYTRTKRFLVDDQIGVKDGDIVNMEKIRPLSKMKHWRIINVIGRDIGEIVSGELQESAEKVISEVMPMEEEKEEVVETEKEALELPQAVEKVARKGKKV